MTGKSDFDLVIRRATIADGTGGPLYEGDVAIAGGLIAQVGKVAGRGQEEIDAKGLLLTPGFIDVHTHYDGQAVWSDRLLSSSWHGVTTAIMGNCGVGFAPVRRGDERVLVALMEGVEDIPGAVLDEGLDWQWESFGDFSGRVASRPHDVDIGFQLAHAPLRVYVMGQRAIDLEPATDSDIAQMRLIARDAVRAGALGFSTSRTLNHRTLAGACVPSLRSSELELTEIAMGLRDGGGAVIEFISDWDTPSLEEEHAMVCRVVRKSGQPLSFSLGQRHSTPNVWSELSRLNRQARAAGVKIVGQVAPRPIGVLSSLQGSVNLFSECPSYAQVASLRFEDRVAALRSPALRSKLLAERPASDIHAISRNSRALDRVYRLGTPPEYEPPPDASVAAIAAREGRSEREVVYDMLMENEGRNFLFSPVANYAEGNLDIVRQMLNEEDNILGLGDGGAHVSCICDASFPTYLLTHWGRDRKSGRFELPWLVRRLTSDNAKFLGLHDRGVIGPGLKADLNLIDMASLGCANPYMAYDLPAGGHRLLQGASGYVATVQSGQVTYRDGEPTGALPGRIVNGRTRLAASTH